MSNTQNNQQRDLMIMFKYMIGQPVEQIAKSSKVSLSTLYKVLKSYNIPLKSEKEASEYFRRRIFTMLLKEKKTVQQIAQELGLPYDLVNGYIRFEYDRMQKEEAKKKASVKQLGIDGLVGRLDSSSKTGLNISLTEEEKRKREEFEKKESKVKDDVLVDLFGDEFSDREKVKLVLLRELLRYASEVTNMPDYSRDPLLLPDYLLPIDIVIMKDITARSVNGESVEEIAKVHRTDVQLVIDVIEKGIPREEFRDRFIKSLVKRGLIQL